MLCSAAAAALITRLPRTYRSETLILYREGIRQVYIAGAEYVGNDPARKLGVRLKEMVFSRTKLMEIIDQLKLYPQVVDERGNVEAVDEMRNHISFRVRDGDTFYLAFEGSDPKTVQTVTAKLAEALVEENSKNKSAQAAETKDFLDDTGKQVAVELAQRETALATFLSEHRDFARELVPNIAGSAIRAELARGKSGPGPAAKRAPIAKSGDPLLDRLLHDAARLEAQLADAPQKPAEKSKEADPKLVAAKAEADAELATLRKELAAQLTRFTTQHPDVQALQARVKAAETRTRRAAEALTSTVEPPPPPAVRSEAEKRAAEAELTRVRAEIAARRAKPRPIGAAVTPEPPPAAVAPPNGVIALETEWQRLNREVSEARERMQQMQDKQFKASMQARSVNTGKSSMIEVLDQAYLPTRPVKASRKMLFAVGVAVSLLFGLALALGLALLDDRLYDRLDVERVNVAPLLAVMPRERKVQKQLPAHRGPPTPASETDRG